MFVKDVQGIGRAMRAAFLPDGGVGAPQTVFSGDEPNVTDFDLSADGRLLAYSTERTMG